MKQRKMALLMGGMLAATLPFTLSLAQAGTADTSADAPGPVLTDAQVRTRADALLARMTDEEKAGQLAIHFYIPRPPLSDMLDKGIGEGTVGNVLFVSNPALANRLQQIAVTQSRLKIPLLLGFDVVHGLRTIMPVPLALAASWDPALATEVQTAAAAEARASGITWTFAPMIDVAPDPRWGRIVEGAGEDPYLASAMAAAQVRGFQGARIGAPGHIIAGPKHLAGYGASLGGRDYDQVDLSDEQLWNIYLPPFKAAIEAGAGNVMSAYMPLNGVPAAANRWLLTDVLRKTLGFDGFVVSDANSVRALVTQGLAADEPEAAARAIGAGLDMEMVAPGATAAAASIPGLLEAGKLTQSQVDDAVRNVLEMKIRLGLFENPYVDVTAAAATLDSPAHLELARKAAARSAVLLRNEGAVLPLDGDRVSSIALIGPLANTGWEILGSWSFPFNNPPSVTVLDALRARLGTGVRLDYSEGVRLPVRINPSPTVSLEPPPPAEPLDETAEIARAVAMAAGSDVAILALGEGQNMSGEAASRASFRLPGRQQELLDAVIATGKPVIVLLFSARPVDLGGARPAAVLNMWYPGSAGGEAAIDLLFGYSDPGGKLPISWVADAAQTPNPYWQLPSFDAAKSDKHYWDVASSRPTYSFGFGLAYTSFSYADLHAGQATYQVGSPVTISVELANTGPRAGEEVAQLYIHQRSGTSARPARLLKGFQRVQLNSGERRRLTFTLQPEDLRYWSAATRDWVADAATFDVWVGGASDATLTTSFTTTAD